MANRRSTKSRPPRTDDMREQERFASGVVQTLENPNVLNQSIQYGTITISVNETVGDATITAVDWTKSLIVLEGQYSTNATGFDSAKERAILSPGADSTHVRATRQAASATIIVTVGFAVVSFT